MTTSYQLKKWGLRAVQNIQNHLLGAILLILFEALTPLNWTPLADLSILAVPVVYEQPAQPADPSCAAAEVAAGLSASVGNHTGFMPALRIVIARRNEVLVVHNYPLTEAALPVANH